MRVQDVSWHQMVEQLQFANAQMDWDGDQPSEPWLWLEAGHPKLPATAQLFAAETQLLCLMELLR